MAVLIGDRFVRLGGDWIDLVTGSAVDLRVGQAPRDLDARRRLCAEARDVLGSQGPRVIDYGEAGVGNWFEARPARQGGLDASTLALRRIPRNLDVVVAAAAASAPDRRGCLHVRVVAPPRSGWRTAIDDVARAMRRAGFVTVRADLALPSGLRKQLRHRHLALLATDAAARAALSRWAAELMQVSDRAHLLIERASEWPAGDRDGTLTIALAPCTPEQLLGACAVDVAPEARIGEAAAHSAGWPGRFVDAWMARLASPSTSALRDRSATAAQGGPDRVWPFSVSAVPADAPARLIQRAERCQRRGRRAESHGWLHAGLESARRRGDAGATMQTLDRWVPRLIADGDAERAASLAMRALRDAHDPCQRAALARLAATAHLDAAHLSRAEACLETAICIEQLTEHRASEASLAVRAALRFWQGRWVDGQVELAALARDQQEDARVALWRDWLSWASDDASDRRGLCFSPDTADRAYRFGLRAFRAAAGGDKAEVRAALVGDLGIPPVWRAVMAAQAWIECGETAAAIEAVSCGMRPPTRRGVADAAMASLRVSLGVASASEAAWLDRVVTRDRLKGVVRFGQGRTTMQMWHDVAVLLEVVQGSEDEASGLQQVCAWVRSATGATACTLIGAPSGRHLAGDPLDVSATVVRQWLDRPAEVIDDGPMASRVCAPVRYAGVVVGVLVAVGTPARARTVLSAVQAAAAVTGALARARLDAEASGARTDELARDILGASPAMVAVRTAVARAAMAPFPVVIEGESGTGKELVARALHRLGPRRDRPFAALNCAALTDELVEAELFGHARGAFTHAVNARAGLFEEAHHGTLFLDEVGDLSPRAQAKLLRVLQEGEIRRVGENEPRAVDVRVVCATNRPLAALVAAGRFRDDLMFRLSVIRIEVPPLRERRGDVAALAAAFWRQAARRVGTRAVLGADALGLLGEWPWPGNVRELQNAMAAVAVAAPATGRVGARLVRQVLRQVSPGAEVVDVVPLDTARRDVERRVVSAALARHTGSRTAAAHALGLSRQGLSKAIRRLGLAEAGVA